MAGSSSTKPYLFNADNVARYAPSTWHSAGTIVDTSYDALDMLARSPVAYGPERPSTGPAEPVDEPDLLHGPTPELGFAPPCADMVAGRDVWLLHPWALRPPPADLPAGTVVVGLCLQHWHQAWPWTRARWQFVARAITPPYRPRRFDARFFLADAEEVLASFEPVAGEELLHTKWFSLDDAEALDLPSITRFVLKEVRLRLAGQAVEPPFLRFLRGSHQMDRLKS